MWLNLAVINLPPGWEHDQAVANREQVADVMLPIEIAAAHLLAQQWAGKMGSDNGLNHDQSAGSIVIEVEF